MDSITDPNGSTTDADRDIHIYGDCYAKTVRDRHGVPYTVFYTKPKRDAHPADDSGGALADYAASEHAAGNRG